MSRRPHILILMTDQQRHDCLGCAGHPSIATPNMDHLAARGMRFTQATTVSPVCMPARASFINSLYPHNHGMWWNSGRMPADDPCLFHLLHEAGYTNAYVGKSHYYVHEGNADHLRDHEPYMHARGIDWVHETTGPYATLRTRSYMTDEWEKKGLYEAFKEDYRYRATGDGLMTHASPLPVEDFPDSYVGRRAVEFIDTCAADGPVCLFVGFGGPHDPWDAPEPYASMYDPAAMPPAIPAPEGTADLPPAIRDMPDLRARADLTPEVVGRIRANYCGKISLVDYWFGEILTAAARRGWDDLLVVFWSDHGEMAGDHGRIQKCTFHENSVRVPLILSWPGTIPAGTTSDALVEIVDIMPTLAAAVGLAVPSRCQGRSLFPLFADPAAAVRDCQLSEIAWQGHRNVMLRDHAHKYVVTEAGMPYMCHDLAADPTEQHNLAAVPNPELRDRLLARLLEAQYVM